MASILKVVKGSLKYACYTLNYIIYKVYSGNFVNFLFMVLLIIIVLYLPAVKAYDINSTLYIRYIRKLK